LKAPRAGVERSEQKQEEAGNMPTDWLNAGEVKKSEQETLSNRVLDVMRGNSSLTAQAVCVKLKHSVAYLVPWVLYKTEYPGTSKYSRA
jgi:uncharacterized lipoprotein